MYKKNLALVAHDNRKKDLIEWVKFNRDRLSKHKLICTYGNDGPYGRRDDRFKCENAQVGTFGW